MTTRRPGRLLRSTLLGALVVAALGACVGVPTAGPVEVGVDGVSEPGLVMPLGEGPMVDASPEQIVQGFLSASASGFNRDPGAGVSNDFRDAREFLAGAVSGTWNPSERVIVYSSAPEITLVSDAQVQVKLTVEARVDADGRYAEAAPDVQEPLAFDLIQDSSGQWRISGLEDGVVFSLANFVAVYRAAEVYFLSPDEKFLVPETRWFPNVNLTTSVVQALIAGPSPWLRDAVRTAVPDGVTLVPDAVPIDSDGTAQIGLSGAVIASPTDRALLLAQIEASLPRVPAVEVTTGGVPLDVEPADLERGVDVDSTVEVIQGDALMALVQNELVAVDGVAPLTGLDVRATARNEDGTLRVLQSGDDTLMSVPTVDAAAVPLLIGTDLVAPSVDRLGWVWTATSGAPDTIVAVRADGTRADVDAEWLSGRSVRSIRVARDGTRIAVLSTGPSGVTLDVAAVLRDEEGTPQQLGDPLGVGASLVDASSVVWVDDVTLGVLGAAGATAGSVYHLVPTGGQTDPLPALDGAITIAGGKGVRALYTATSTGELFWGTGQSWRAVATGVRDPSLPG